MVLCTKQQLICEIINYMNQFYNKNFVIVAFHLIYIPTNSNVLSKKLLLSKNLTNHIILVIALSYIIKDITK